jgi:hypothetical protein
LLQSPYPLFSLLMSNGCAKKKATSLRNSNGFNLKSYQKVATREAIIRLAPDKRRRIYFYMDKKTTCVFLLIIYGA